MHGFNFWDILTVAIAYLLAVGLSGLTVRYFIGLPPTPRGTTEGNDAPPVPRFEIGAIIGKCENIIVITFVLAGAYTGLALIFTAKSIVRSDDIKRDPRYFLGGTLVNFVFSVLIGFAARIAVETV